MVLGTLVMEAELLKGFQREALGHKEQISVLFPELEKGVGTRPRKRYKTHPWKYRVRSLCN